jgi:tetratricopeptide (TPR) repeat protein
MEGAIADFSRAIVLHPTFAPSFTNRGLARAMKGELDGAIADYNQALKLDPREALAFYNRGTARRDKGDYEGAIADYDASIQINPNHTNSYYQRGCVWRKRGELDKAIADLNKAIELSPRDASAHVHRAFARQAKGGSDGAAADFARAKALYGSTGTVAFYDDKPVSQGSQDHSPATKVMMRYTTGAEGPCWVLAEQTQAVLCCPEGWHFKAGERGSSIAYFITREPIPDNAAPGSYQFETGFTINVWCRFGLARGQSPSAYALEFVQTLAQAAEHETEITWQKREDPFIGYGVQFCSESDRGQLRQRHQLIGNDTTGTLYFVIFEAPKRHWERDWPVAEEVLKHLRFNPDV